MDLIKSTHMFLWLQQYLIKSVLFITISKYQSNKFHHTNIMSSALPASSSSSPAPNNNKDKKSSSSDNNKKKDKQPQAATTATKASAPPPPATHVAVHFALATRTPKEKGGGIISIAAVCFNPDTRQITETFERNVLPIPAVDQSSSSSSASSLADSFLIGNENISCSFPNIMNPDTQGYWGSTTRVKEYKAITEQAPVVHPRDMMKDFYDFCKKNGGSRITMICNPLGAFFSFILHYQETFLSNAGKDYSAPPWGFGAVCARSYFSGVLGGIPLSQVPTNKTYLEWTEGFDSNQTLQPIATAVVAAVTYTNAHTFVQKKQSVHDDEKKKVATMNNDDEEKTEDNNTPTPVQWLCPIPTAAAKGYCIPDPLGDTLKVPFVPSTGKDKNNNNKQKQEKTNATDDTGDKKKQQQEQEKEKLQLLLYPSITDADFSIDEVENSVAKWANEKHPEIEWVAQEKVHGSNLSFGFDVNSNKVFAARREAPLSQKDCGCFFGFDFLLHDIKSEIKVVIDEIVKNCGASNANNNDNKKLVLVQFFGEICGGDYDDRARVSPCIGSSRVQRGVLYAPWHCYYIFDCVVHFAAAPSDDGEDDEQQQQVARYLSYDELSQAFSKIISSSSSSSSRKQLLLAPTLARGSFNEINSSVACEFESKFHSWVGLPSRKQDAPANFAEGIILRPVHDLLSLKKQLVPLSVLANSNSKKEASSEELCYRPLIKKKHPMFREFSGPSSLFDDSTSPEQLFKRMITVTRVASVVSKMTKTERENEEKVVAAMVQDVVKDIKEIVKKRNKKNAVPPPNTNDKDDKKNDDDDKSEAIQQPKPIAVPATSVFDEKAAAKNEENLKSIRTAVKSYLGGYGH